ncbi:ATP-dependent zinc metalloprotease ftsh mitochondrial-like, partial [Trifolium pratense]
ATRHQSELAKLKPLFHKRGNRLLSSQERFQSSFLGNLSRRLLGGLHDETSQQNNPEAVIREFESQSSLHANPEALSQYVKALVKLDRLDQSQFLLNTLQRGLGMNEEVKPIVESNITFKDVIGAYYPKKELKEIVEYLRDPECCARLGKMIPKGYLLAGPTGTGKTMLARAVAGEAGVPFFSCNGREFETYFGDGAQRMRDLFAAAKKRSPSIIFIDEIDQIYTKRTFDQLLVELDGSNQNDCIFVIAATDVPDSLHMSLVKNGRFDRCVDVLKPNSDEKLEILESLMSKVPKANDVSLDMIAIYTDQFSGADLANMVNLAALEAARDGAKAVTFSHMMSAMDEIRMTKGNPDGYEEQLLSE